MSQRRKTISFEDLERLADGELTQINPPPEIFAAWRKGNEPHPTWVRGHCPECGAPLVSVMYHARGKGHALVWQCWKTLQEEPACTYKRIL